MKRGSFAAGFLTCLLLAGVTTTAYAAGIMAERSHHRIIVDGKEAQMEAYVINGNNYVKLRDIGKAVGFEVYWDSENGCVQVESGKPYTGEEPAKDGVIKPTPQPEPTVPTNDADVDAMKQDIIDRTNALRKENGVAVLRVNDRLMQAAQVRADEMAASGIYSHTRPDGRRNTSVTIARMLVKIFTASQIGRCRVNRHPRSPCGRGTSPVDTGTISSKRITLKPAWDSPEESMTMARRAGTASSSSCGMVTP